MPDHPKSDPPEGKKDEPKAEAKRTDAGPAAAAPPPVPAPSPDQEPSGRPPLREVAADRASGRFTRVINSQKEE